MAISFNEIPGNLREPGTYIEIDSSLAVRGLQGMPHKTLIVGQKLAAGDAANHELRLITDPEDAALAFGRGSMIHAMAVAYRAANRFTELWAMATADAGGAVADIRTVTFSKIDGGADFGSGSVNLWIAGRLLRVGLAPSDTVADLTARLVSEAAEHDLPVTVAQGGVSDENLVITARHPGAAGALIDVRMNHTPDQTTPANLNVAIAATTPGAADPVIDTALAAASSEWWTEIVCPYVDVANTDAVHAYLAARFVATEMQDGVAFIAEQASVAGHFTASASRNSPHITVLPHQSSPTPTWEAAANYAGVAAHQTQIDPARQLKTLALTAVVAPKIEDRFTPEEMNLLLHSGISSARVEGGALRLWCCVTTYQTSPGGADDPAYLDLVTMTLLAYLRWSERQRIDLRFPRHKLANDGTRFGPGQAIATPEIIRNELIALYREWEIAGLVEDADSFADLLIVERDGGDPNRVNSLQSPDLINNLRIFAAKIQFRL